MLNQKVRSVSRIMLEAVDFHQAKFTLYTFVGSHSSKGVFYTRKLIDNLRSQKYCSNRELDICCVCNLRHFQHFQSVTVIRGKLGKNGCRFALSDCSVFTLHVCPTSPCCCHSTNLPLDFLYSFSLRHSAWSVSGFSRKLWLSVQWVPSPECSPGSGEQKWRHCLWCIPPGPF